MAGHPRERSPRLLVLGAGPGAARAARGRAGARDLDGGLRPRSRRRPGFQLADRRCIVSTEDEPAIERLAAALELDGVISPGTDWPVAIAARDRREARPAAPDLAGDGGARDEQAAPARGARRGGRPAAALAVCGADEARRARRRPCVVKAPDRQGQKGLSLVRRRRASSPTRSTRARGARAAALALVEEFVDGPEVTVIGFSVGGEFVPLAVTDRITADRPRSASRSRTSGRRRTPRPPPRSRGARSRRSGSRTARPTPSCGSARTGPR